MSFVAWLDHSTEDERRVREMIRLFDQPETQDALGFGQLRDAYGDLLFPGTSTLHTRAKYLLFIPWCSLVAARRTSDPARLERLARDNERRLIRTLGSLPKHDGLIGSRAGLSVRNLPSASYATALERWRIADSTLDQAFSPDDDGEPTSASNGWHRRLPPPPSGFPEEAPGGFDLTFAEAEYLRGRLLSTEVERPSVLSYIADHLASRIEAPNLWDEPSLAGAPAVLRDDVLLARTFSAVSHGANLLYNLLIARAYEAHDYTSVAAPVEGYETALTKWAESLAALGQSWPTWGEVRLRAADQNPRVLLNSTLDQFAETWFAMVGAHGPDIVWRLDEAHDLVRRRELSVKRLQSRFTNPTMLARWGGSSGAGAFEFRWPQVRRLLNDLGDGLRSDSAVA